MKVLRFEIDYKGLEKFLKTLDYEKIKNGALTEAHTMYDIELFYKTDEEKKKISYDQVINYGHPFLVDAIGNDLSICLLTKRKYKLPTGRVCRMKFVKTIIEDCRKEFGSPVNDLFVIPDIFIIKT